MKRGLMVLFVVAVLMLNMAGVCASLSQNPPVVSNEEKFCYECTINKSSNGIIYYLYETSTPALEFICDPLKKLSLDEKDCSDHTTFITAAELFALPASAFASDDYSVKSSTDTVQGAPIVALPAPEMPDEQSLASDTFGSGLASEKTKDSIPEKVKSILLSMMASFFQDRLNTRNPVSSASAVRGEDNAQIAKTVAMPLISFFYS
ncbi:MAG: hypothetical protein KKE23_02115 [Nanoarchaeota archaeon]|nr:hypothetical protein [Nanoarchaeota archaeon]